MACYRPLKAYQLENRKIVFSETADVWRALDLPCGKCVGCLLERSRQWAVRCMHESQMHDVSCFITLTYDDDHLPYRGTLRHSHFQKFMKRARGRLGPFRFFMCGEYGDENFRPHYHACLFGVFFPDRVRFKESGADGYIYTSDLLSSLWPYGFASVGDLTFESAAYVARYVTKKSGESSDSRYLRCDDDGVAYKVDSEYARMSLKPGIGATWWAKFGKEVLSRGNVVMRGVEMKPPRYYGKLCSNPLYDLVEFKSGLNVRPEDNTEERLRVREVVATARLNLKKRNI